MKEVKVVERVSIQGKKTTLDYAREYVSKGFSVIPLKPQSKTPAIDSWKEFQERRPTESELKEWFSGADNNIAIVTGKISGIIVVDLDSKEAVDFAKGNFHETLSVKTGRGFHLYFKYPRDREVRNFQKRDDLPGIDLRADGGYVVAPPSIHESGALYRWLNREQSLADLPEIVLPKKQDKNHLIEFYKGVSEGQRNNALTRLIGSFVNDGATLDDCHEMAEIWNASNIPPLPREELARTVKSIFNKHQRGLSYRPSLYRERQQDNQDYQGFTGNQEEIEDGDYNPLDVVQSGAALMKLDIKVEWLVDKLIPENSITLLHGSGGIGKTWITLMMANAVTRGIPFMELDTSRTRVVYIDYENPLPVLVERVRWVNSNRIKFWHRANEIKPPKLDSNNWHIYKKFGPCLLVIDTLRSSQSRDENDSRDMGFIMGRLKKLRDMGFTILLLHHTPKSNERTYKGSTAILDLADHVLSLHKVKRKKEKGKEVMVESDDDEGAFYRFGTKDKTRYTPFHMFLEFVEEKGFVLAKDPDIEDIEKIHRLIKDKPQQNQTQIFELVKRELHITSKDRFYKLLKKGEGNYWNAVKSEMSKAILYRPIVPLYIDRDNETTQQDAHKERLTVINSDEQSAKKHEAMIDSLRKALIPLRLKAQEKNKMSESDNRSNNKSEGSGSQKIVRKKLRKSNVIIQETGSIVGE